MTIKNTTLSLFLLLSIHLFSQEATENKAIEKIDTKLSYLDSIKNSFVEYDLASCVDSLWMNEMTNLDLYNNLTEDIENINIDEKVDYELPTALLKERLAAMNAKSPFNIEYNQGLENIIKSFLKYRKKSFERLMATSEYYFPMFEEALAKQNVPLEIKYLAVVESALNPKAVSKMGATGLWQFMYQTGKQYGLKIDSYVDERSDPLKASEAAAQYMTNMYKIFGDWDLVLASYNSGPGNVSKAIRRSGGQQNYWNIRKNLPRETQGYVPAFLATMYLYEYHKEHGIVPQRATIKHFTTDTILIKKQITFKQISDLLDVPVVQLQVLNPSYKLDIIPFYHDQNHYLRLPQEKIAVFASNESPIYAYTEYESGKREKPYFATKTTTKKEREDTGSQRIAQSHTTQYYKVKKGDNLGAIASKYDVSIADLRQWNALSSNVIVYGKNLKISSNEGTVSDEVKKNSDPIQALSEKQIAASLEENAAVASTESKAYYIVQKGDNLNTIAKKNKVTVAEIQQWNNLSDANVLLGTSLNMGSSNAALTNDLTVTPVVKNIEYEVQKGDNLERIAKKFGTSASTLKQWNKISGQTIVLGSSLIVAKGEPVINTNRPTISYFKKKTNGSGLSQKETVDYYVKKGDSLYSISKKYPGVTISDLKKWNGIRGEELKPGMKLKING
ncbi:LysM peptidoglycan-binding domain-containing protein [Flavobacterium sp. RSP49]|uniref:LysM peptidoglycan-binding domain-containing protein n=1 Tax=Flavobacterium sp. RSP49 TaxID=2497487 RepID=UPI000F83DFDD|nr:lytic transglycosylase domain-containing protein [Flavobacterium sp. RSP49]RTZ02232.1 LysM peptidoglycan-binding domain-containing protein [Flavobacterium sp. RSP49]